jgi:hypothetical protein
MQTSSPHVSPFQLLGSSLVALSLAPGPFLRAALPHFRRVFLTIRVSRLPLARNEAASAARHAPASEFSRNSQSTSQPFSMMTIS